MANLLRISAAILVFLLLSCVSQEVESILCSCGRYRKGFSCKTCPAGYKCSGNSFSPDNPCPAGYRSPSGSCKCYSCGYGQYSTAIKSSSCSTCPANTYCSSSVCTKCTACSSGATSSAGSSKCTCCAKGTYYSSTKKKCVSASANYYVSASCRTSQIKCPAGRYSNAGASSCTCCSPGTYSSTSGSSCISATRGYYVLNSCQSNQAPASPGYYVENAAASSQTPCLAGHYCPNSTMISPVGCSVNQYQPNTGSTKCLPCASGTDTQSLTHQLSCQCCPIGFYNKFINGTSCRKTDPGFYQNKTCSIGQIATPRGFFTNSSGIQPIMCDFGAHKCPAAGLIHPIPCEKGYFALVTPGIPTISCLPCPLHSYSNNPNGSLSCTSCKVFGKNFGTTKPGSSTCTPCSYPDCTPTFTRSITISTSTTFSETAVTETIHPTASDTLEPTDSAKTSTWSQTHSDVTPSDSVHRNSTTPSETVSLNSKTETTSYNFNSTTISDSLPITETRSKLTATLTAPSDTKPSSSESLVATESLHPTYSPDITLSNETHSSSKSEQTQSVSNAALTYSENMTLSAKSKTETDASPERETMSETILHFPPPPRLGLSAAAQEALQSSTAVVSSLTSVAAAPAAMSIARGSAVVSLIGCPETNPADNEKWPEDKVSFPQSLLPNIGFGSRKGHFYRSGIVGFVVLAFFAFFAGYFMTESTGRNLSEKERKGGKILTGDGANDADSDFDSSDEDADEEEEEEEEEDEEDENLKKLEALLGETENNNNSGGGGGGNNNNSQQQQMMMRKNIEFLKKQQEKRVKKKRKQQRRKRMENRKNNINGGGSSAFKSLFTSKKVSRIPNIVYTVVSAMLSLWAPSVGIIMAGLWTSGFDFGDLCLAVIPLTIVFSLHIWMARRVHTSLMQKPGKGLLFTDSMVLEPKRGVAVRSENSSASSISEFLFGVNNNKKINKNENSSRLEFDDASGTYISSTKHTKVAKKFSVSQFLQSELGRFFLMGHYFWCSPHGKDGEEARAIILSTGPHQQKFRGPRSTISFINSASPFDNDPNFEHLRDFDEIEPIDVNIVENSFSCYVAPHFLLICWCFSLSIGVLNGIALSVPAACPTIILVITVLNCLSFVIALWLRPFVVPIRNYIVIFLEANTALVSVLAMTLLTKNSRDENGLLDDKANTSLAAVATFCQVLVPLFGSIGGLVLLGLTGFRRLLLFKSKCSLANSETMWANQQFQIHSLEETSKEELKELEEKQKSSSSPSSSFSFSQQQQRNHKNFFPNNNNNSCSGGDSELLSKLLGEAEEQEEEKRLKKQKHQKNKNKNKKHDDKNNNLSSQQQEAQSISDLELEEVVVGDSATTTKKTANNNNNNDEMTPEERKEADDKLDQYLHSLMSGEFEHSHAASSSSATSRHSKKHKNENRSDNSRSKKKKAKHHDDDVVL